MEYDLSMVPTVPLRSIIVFPKMVTHLDIGREKSIKAVEAAMATDRIMAVTAQLDDYIEEPTYHDLNRVGTLVRIKQLLRVPGGMLRVLVEGLERIEIEELVTTDPFYYCSAKFLESYVTDNNLAEAHRRLVYRRLSEWAKEGDSFSDEMMHRLQQMSEPSEFADAVIFHMIVRQQDKQRALDEPDVIQRLQLIDAVIAGEIEVIHLEGKLNNKVREQMEKSQKEYFLREKIRVIHDELGDKVSEEDEANEFRERLAAIEVSGEVREKIEREIARFERMPQMMPEANILRNYLDWVLNLPWTTATDDRLDIQEASDILEADHYGLEKIKERILEFLAVKKLSKKPTGSILCLVGPPGVGKTSLATSVARAMNRKFVRVSLGGIRDEAEIRGHRRTYIGALPGRMIQGIKTAGTNNPVFLLDEIDKLGFDYKGDPSSALLELLDPEQNKAFSDHFIEIPFDFSKVFWIATANDASHIPAPLLDRMEVIRLSSYMEEEKLEIAKRYLVPKQVERHGLEPKQLKLSEAVLKRVISEYTAEAGVRTLEKVLAKLCRKVAYKLLDEEGKVPRITVKNLPDYLGVPIYLEDEREKAAQVGLVNGLAWTAIGGTMLPCEVATMPGTGKLQLTGSLGKVMVESGQAAWTYIRHNAKDLGIADDFHTKLDVHVHFPEGAIPKDGPSAGVTMTLAIISALTERKVRADVAMTGEISIRGRVLPIGGLKEKLLAALRQGIKEVFIPHRNVKDLADLPASVKDGLTITPVKNMEEIIAKALMK